MSPSVRAMAALAVPGFALSMLSLCTGQTASGKKPQPKSDPPATVAPAMPKMGPPAPDARLLAFEAPAKQKFVYAVEWRLIRAGTVTLEATPSGEKPTAMSMKLESGGLVASLFKVNDTYSTTYDEPFCATSMKLDALEGKRHRETLVSYDRATNHAHYVERELPAGNVLRDQSVDLLPCSSDALGALIRMRTLSVEPGQSVQIPVSDGRRTAMVKVDAQDREEVRVPMGTFKTIRYEASLLNGVIYPRKGRAFIWYTDDSRHLPVQIRFRMNFPISTVTLGLEKLD
jgi:Protein of unknown function (DUF3108)